MTAAFDINLSAPLLLFPPRSYFVAQTKPNCEEYATRFLRADKFNVYFPRVLQRRVHAGKVQFVPRPFFARYIFIENNDRGGPFYFRSAPGMSSIVRRGGDAVTVHQDVIDEIQGRENAQGFIDEDEFLPASDTDYSNGDRVRVKRGKFAMMDGVFSQRRAQTKGEDRAEVFIQLLGRVTKTTVRWSDLERV